MLQILQAIIFFAAWSLIPFGRRWWRSQNRDLEPDPDARLARDTATRRAAEKADAAIDRAGEVMGFFAMIAVWCADFWLLPGLSYRLFHS